MRSAGPDGGAVTTAPPSPFSTAAPMPSEALVRTRREIPAAEDHTEFTEAFHRIVRDREHEAVISTGDADLTARIDVSAFGDTAQPIPRPPAPAAAITGIAAAPAVEASGSAATS